MQKITALLKESFNLFPEVLRRIWPWMLISMAFEAFSGVVMGMVTEKETPFYYCLILIVFGLGLIFSTVGVIIVNQLSFDAERKIKTPIGASLSVNFKQSMIESMRAMLPILAKFLLLIIPGIVELVRLYWIIYIVQFDDDYKTGKVDALDKSRALVKGRFWNVSAVLLFAFGLSILPRVFTGEGDILKAPVRFALTFFLFITLEIYGDIVLYRYYMGIKNGTQI